jgi:toxin ParE1/3/4
LKTRPVVPRAAAGEDVDRAIDDYLRDASAATALGFIDALEKAYRHISRAPGSGSPRYAHELDIPGLRSWPLRGYPHIVFYVERVDHIDVWRVLHGERDIPEMLRG